MSKQNELKIELDTAGISKELLVTLKHKVNEETVQILRTKKEALLNPYFLLNTDLDIILEKIIKEDSTKVLKEPKLPKFEMYIYDNSISQSLNDELREQHNSYIWFDILEYYSLQIDVKGN